METEKQLLTAILNGNQQAMRQLYERYCGYAMTVALRYIPDRDAVQDVLQDSFVKAFSAIQRFCLLYTSDAADELDGVDLGGRRIIKKKKKKKKK